VIAGQVPFEVELQRQPDNEHDTNAIAIVITDRRVTRQPLRMGYLRKEISMELADALDTGRMKVVEATVVSMGDELAEVKVKSRITKPKIHS